MSKRIASDSGMPETWRLGFAKERGRRTERNYSAGFPRHRVLGNRGSRFTSWLSRGVKGAIKIRAPYR